MNKILKLPEIDSPICNEIFNKTKLEIESLSIKLKMDNLSLKFFKEIVIPLAVYFNSLKKDDYPYLIGFTGGQEVLEKLLFQILYSLFYASGLIEKQLGFQ
tara:strand:- start:260 stop:562 length:303 start_codon:yes stop_codon:yes gene_type:complete